MHNHTLPPSGILSPSDPVQSRTLAARDFALNGAADPSGGAPGVAASTATPFLSTRGVRPEEREALYMWLDCPRWSSRRNADADEDRH